MAILYRGQADVSRWCGVASPSVVSNWIRRFPDTYPAPDAEIMNEDSPFPTRGWLPERRKNWETFAAERRRRPVVTGRNRARQAREAAEMVYADMQAGKITPAEAAALLRELF